MQACHVSCVIGTCDVYASKLVRQKSQIWLARSLYFSQANLEFWPVCIFAYAIRNSKLVSMAANDVHACTCADIAMQIRVLQACWVPAAINDSHLYAYVAASTIL